MFLTILSTPERYESNTWTSACILQHPHGVFHAIMAFLAVLFCFFWLAISRKRITRFSYRVWCDTRRLSESCFRKNLQFCTAIAQIYICKATIKFLQHSLSQLSFSNLIVHQQRACSCA